MALLVLTVACTKTDPSPVTGEAKTPNTPARPSGPSLVLVTMDTTRTDHIGAYGYAIANTPNVDSLAAEGVRFDRAYASIPLTTPSHATMLTGTYPPRHGVHNNGDSILPDEAVSLAEILQEKGYHTGASVSAFVTTKVWNLDQGFDIYADSVSKGGKRPKMAGAKDGKARNRRQANSRWSQERPANEVVDDAIEFIGGLPKKDEPFFLWVHFYDPHQPLEAPEPWASAMPNRPYDAEIAFMDEQIGRLKQTIDATGQKVAWMAVADHGEAKGGEHGEHDHGTFLFDATMHIPFIIRPPEPIPGGKAVATTVGNVDVMPTALGMLGLPVPEGLDGKDLTPMIKGEGGRDQGVYMESVTVANRFGYHPEIGLVEGPLKLMKTPNPRLFDVSADPGELTNIISSRPDDVKRMGDQIDAFRAATRTATTNTAVASPEVMAQLEALGYMGAGENNDAAETSTVDAKDKLDVIKRLDETRRIGKDPSKRKEAIATYRAILAAEPQIAEARLELTRLLTRDGDFPEAEKVLREALTREPSSTVLHSSLASNLTQQKRLDEALIEYQAILIAVPGDETANVGYVNTLFRLDRKDEAVAKCLERLAVDPKSYALHSLAGVMLTNLSRFDEAEPHLIASLGDDIPRREVHEMLARIATVKGDEAGMVSELYLELEINPRNRPVRQALARYFMQQRQWDDAVAEFQALSEETPNDPAARMWWAQAVFNSGAYDVAAEVLAPVLTMAPDYAEAIMLQANIVGKLGDREQAEKLANEAKELKATQGNRPPRVIDEGQQAWPEGPDAAKKGKTGKAGKASPPAP
jgi:arylsulfatase A-like enzyme/Flp pilus assembly protein TadD